MFVIVRNDNWVWNHGMGIFSPGAEPDSSLYVCKWRANRVAVRVGSLQGSTGEPLTVLPLGDWIKQTGEA